ncbi:hypothetical protein [Dactylosporangium fulvum]|uniref:Uncharacterized protein n=1 Tax=Dactylosporangium fulvum TaxID=53359 RepID=A0ABY5WAF5_9ACTN|nr:hypothetical protein [Dactylosporangium fulvum]UWP85678.1 hypothetical protein Dfulv_16125 [Dactylosporangium fulvum]
MPGLLYGASEVGTTGQDGLVRTWNLVIRGPVEDDVVVALDWPSCPFPLAALPLAALPVPPLPVPPMLPFPPMPASFESDGAGAAAGTDAPVFALVEVCVQPANAIVAAQAAAIRTACGTEWLVMRRR